jgi:hypothetical protein
MPCAYSAQACGAFFDALPLRCLSACGAPRGARRSCERADTIGLRFSARHPPRGGELFDMTSRAIARRGDEACVGGSSRYCATGSAGVRKRL